MTSVNLPRSHCQQMAGLEPKALTPKNQALGLSLHIVQVCIVGIGQAVALQGCLLTSEKECVRGGAQGWACAEMGEQQGSELHASSFLTCLESWAASRANTSYSRFLLSTKMQGRETLFLLLQAWRAWL